MKILVTGASGLLGKYIMKAKKAECYGTWFTNSINSPRYYRLDVNNQSQIMYIFDRLKPDFVIHCAAIGSVDFAEQNYQSVRAINYDGTANIINACNEYRSKLIYVSTNAVYDGTEPPYDENSRQNPINVYGMIKKAAEQLVTSICNQYVIVRPFMLYGINRKSGRKNWLTLIYNKLKNNQEVTLVNDTYWQPTSAIDAAKGVLQLCYDFRSGESYNLACDQTITLYDFGLLIADVFEKDKDLIKPISSSELKLIAKRPIDTSYNTHKIKEFGLQMKNPKEGLEEFRK